MNVGGPLGFRASALRLVWLVPVFAGFFTPAAIRGQSGASPGDITFTKDIAPILQRRCQPRGRIGGETSGSFQRASPRTVTSRLWRSAKSMTFQKAARSRQSADAMRSIT